MKYSLYCQFNTVVTIFSRESGINYYNTTKIPANLAHYAISNAFTTGETKSVLKAPEKIIYGYQSCCCTQERLYWVQRCRSGKQQDWI